MEKGFELNPHDRCVANKMVNSKKCTLVWYVDEKKVSNMESKVVEDLLNNMVKHFGQSVVTRGKIHKSLCMGINITEVKKVEIDMKEQLLEAIQAFGENIDKKVTIPASIHLFIFNGKKTNQTKKTAKYSIWQG